MDSRFSGLGMNCADCNLNRDDMPNVLQYPRVGIGAPMQPSTFQHFGALVRYGTQFTNTRTHEVCDWCGNESRRHSIRLAATAYGF